MEEISSADNSFILAQMKRYARDLLALYKQEKADRHQVADITGQLMKYAEDLNRAFSDLRSLNEELQGSYLDTVNRLSLVAEYKDESIYRHIERMGLYCGLIAEKIGLPGEDVQNIRYASPIHDIGKVGIADSILMKRSKLTEEEFEIIKTHPLIGAKILANSRSEIVQLAEAIAISHHEKWNGKGYPYGLAGYKIPLPGRIVCLADVFDALISRRPYKGPYPVEIASDILKKGRAEHFDPELVDVFLDNIEEMVKIREEIGPVETVLKDNFTWSERDQELML